MDCQLQISTGGYVSGQRVGNPLVAATSGPVGRLSFESLQWIQERHKTNESGTNLVNALCIQLYRNLLLQDVTLPILLVVLFRPPISSLEGDPLPNSYSTVTVGINRGRISNVSSNCSFLCGATNSTLVHTHPLRPHDREATTIKFIGQIYEASMI
jgi:hypothetical protein